MNEDQLFEAELRKLRPAKLPEGLMTGLLTVSGEPFHEAGTMREAQGTNPKASSSLCFAAAVGDDARGAATEVHGPRARGPVMAEGSAGWNPWLGWLAPLTAATVAMAALCTGWWTQRNAGIHSRVAINSNSMEISRQLNASFDAVAQMPGGEPVRFRCREWTEEVTFNDPATGVEITQSTPRLEVVPVGFETY